MERWATRGQPTALAAVSAMVAGGPPQALLLVGPASVGKTTLAGDLAAGLLCRSDDPSTRPCRACRGCRLIAGGNHPDLHRLVPDGPGGQIRIGDARHPEPGTVRALIGEIALLPVEGGRRVVVVEAAHRLNDDAQNALLKTLEEPPAGVTVILCADDEEHLLDTVRSRCARLRLGPVAGRAIEQLLLEQGSADPARAARLGRLAGGRPGLAESYARAPDAEPIRDEIARTLVDLLTADRARRLTVGRELLGRARDLDAALSPAPAASATDRAGRARRSRSTATDTAGGDGEPDAVGGAPPGGSTKVAPAERRRAAQVLCGTWREVALDLAVAGLGGRLELRDPGLLEELLAAASAIPPTAMARFLGRLDRVAELVEGTANPELAIDVLVLAWPRGVTGPAA